MTHISENGNTKTDVSLLKFWEQEVLPRLNADLVYDHPSHGFQRSVSKWRGGSPFRKSKSGTSFAVWPDTLRFYDAGCEFAGDPIAYTHSIKVGRWEHPKGIDWVEALREIASRVGVTLPERELSSREIEVAAKWEARRSILAAVYAQCRDWLWGEAGTSALNHLIAERGIPREAIAELGLGYYHSKDAVAAALKEQNHNLEIAEEVGVLTAKWEGYVTFPWHTAFGQPLTVYGHCPTKPLPLKKNHRGWKNERDVAYRAWGKLSEAQKLEQPWTEPTIPKKYACWNPNDGEGAWLATKESPLYFDRSRADGHKEVVVVEGVTDAAVAQALGDTRVVACVAASLSGEQVQSLRRSGIERAIVCLDPDSAGDKGIESCIKSLLAAGIVPYIAPRLPVGSDGDGDPDKFIIRNGIDAWLEHTSLEKATHGLRWKAQQITGSKGNTDAQKQAALEEAAKWATAIKKDTAALDIFFWPAIGEALGSSPPLWLAEFGKKLGGNTKPHSSSENTPVDVTDHKIDSKLLRDYRKLSTVFSNRLRLNTLSKRIEIDNNPIAIDRAKLQLAIKHNVVLKSGREDVQDMMAELAENNQYSPVAEYLLSLPKPADTSILDSLAPRYLGVSEPIYSSMVRKTLIGAAARALAPGCKVDSALILQSPQGWKKSMFFKLLAGDWFDDSFGAMSDKDERLKLHSAWILEWAELETVFKRKDVAATKAFLSCASDSIRPPYGRETVKMLRPSIIVGTTNETEFLSDTTGNRRFWVVPVKKRIDTQLLEQERDAIWAAAVLAYHSGEHWWLDCDEERTASALVEEFQSLDPWHDPIADFVEHKEWIAVTSVLNHLQVDLNRQERAHQMRVAGVLKLLGWSKALRTVNGKRTRVWVRPLPPPSALNVPSPPSPPEPHFQPNDLPSELQTQPKNELDREVDLFESIAASSFCSVDTTCNFFFTKKKQNQGESGSAEYVSVKGAESLVKDVESCGSGSSCSSNVDIAGFETEIPVFDSRSDSETSRSQSRAVEQTSPESGASINDIGGSKLIGDWVVQLSEVAQQQGVRYEAVKELGVPESLRQQVFSALSPDVKERLTELRKEFEQRIPQDTQRWIGVIETWSAQIGADVLNAQWQQFDLWSQCLSGIGNWAERIVASGLFDSAASRYAEAIELTLGVVPAEANSESNIEPKQLDLLPGFKPKPSADTDNRFSPDSENWL